MSALGNLKVVETATLFAGPIASMLLADFGADVIKVEHPKVPDPARGHGPSKDGVGLWFKSLGRNKQAVTIDLSKSEGAQILLKLVKDADVLIENFRPGTLERWGLGWDVLHAHNPQLILARVTAFGQTGPYSDRPGFGTLAEAMSGFAAVTGEPDGPPTLPPFGLADSIAAFATAFAVMTAVHQRELTGLGQVIDMAIMEPILMSMGAPITAYDQLGFVQPRLGNRSSNNAPRNTYLTGSGDWVAISTSSQQIAERVMHLVGRPRFIEEPWFATGRGRAEHVEELDVAVGEWIASRSTSEVVAAFEQAQAAVAVVNDIRGVMNDPQYQHRGTIHTITDSQLGPMKMQNVLFKLSETPGEIQWTGRSHGADTDEVLAGLGYSDTEIANLRGEGVI